MKEGTVRALLSAMPKRSLSDLAFWITRRHIPAPMLKTVIAAYAKAYGVNLADLDRPLDAFRTFDEFFTRRLAGGARPVNQELDTIVSPCDGTWLNHGQVTNMELTQIKGKTYSLADFLGSESRAECFSDGMFATIYLSPRDYHRVHFPCNGEVTDCHHIPGECFPVNGPSVRSIEHLFARNERMIVYMDTPAGEVAVVMVAATCVSAITPSFDPQRTVLDHTESLRINYPQTIAVSRGDELGVFHMGSTVVLLFQNDKAAWQPFHSGQAVLMGQQIGTWETK